MDEDSGDELMHQLRMSFAGMEYQYDESCSCCGSLGARVVCTQCRRIYYCSATCQQRHFSSHRGFCISRLSIYESDISESELESESEKGDSNVSGKSLVSMKSDRTKRTSSFRNVTTASEFVGAIEKQLKSVIHFATRADESQQNTQKHDRLKHLQQQLAELSEKFSQSKSLGKEKSPSSFSFLRRQSSSERHKSLVRETPPSLESKNASFAQNTRMHASPEMEERILYTPLLIRDDPQYRKFFKLKDMHMPVSKIQAKMRAEGVDPALLQNAYAISPNDKGPSEKAYNPLKVMDDPLLKKYFKLKNLNIPANMVKMKMEAEYVDPELLDHPERISPNDPHIQNRRSTFIS